jgi:hypothetical protein
VERGEDLVPLLIGCAIWDGGGGCRSDISVGDMEVHVVRDRGAWMGCGMLESSYAVVVLDSLGYQRGD